MKDVDRQFEAMLQAMSNEQKEELITLLRSLSGEVTKPLASDQDEESPTIS